MNTWTRRAIAIASLLALVVLACVGLVYRSLWMHYGGALQQLESRSERLDGVVDAGAEIERLLGVARNTVTPLLHPAGENAQNDVQQKLRELIVASGGTLVSSQVALEPGAEGKLSRIRLTATVTGEWSKLVRFMEILQTHRPPFWVRTASLSREGASVAAGPQNARLALQLEAPLSPEKAKP